MREYGALLHISSLPAPGGIGSLGEDAYSFIDFLAEAGAHIWQLLPLGPTGFGDSPYQSFSVFAGNPYFIDLPFLANAGLLDAADLPSATTEFADFDALYRERPALLKKAYSRASSLEGEVSEFSRAHPWVEDYALFMALKRRFGGAPWTEWEDGARLRRPDALVRYRAELAEEIGFERFAQYIFFRQWSALRAYAASRGVKLFGDAPIYVAMDSADVWSAPQEFLLDCDLRPVRVAAVPPDYYSEDGQLWGNPLYDWDAMARDGFSWWRNRIRAYGEMYDMLRIDHFIGFANYYSVAASAVNARDGEWRRGPREALFSALEGELRKISIVAENLGAVTEDVDALLSRTGFPGMAVLTFGFDGSVGNTNSILNVTPNTVCYTSTHDSETLAEWWSEAPPDVRACVLADCATAPDEEPVFGVVRAALASRADTVILPVQDMLRLGAEARMNIPGTLGGMNWRWRMAHRSLTHELASTLRSLAAKSGR